MKKPYLLFWQCCSRHCCVRAAAKPWKNFVAGANRYSRSNSYTVTDSYSHCGTYTRGNAECSAASVRRYN